MIEHPPEGLKAKIPRPYNFEKMVVNFGDREITERVLLSYASQLKKQLPILQSAIAVGKGNEVHRIAHSIRGGAQNIYNPRLREAARALESVAKPRMQKEPAQKLYSILEQEVLVLAESVAYHHNGGET